MRPSQVLKRLNELRKVYQDQTFKFTSEQQKEYDMKQYPEMYKDGKLIES